MLRWAASGALGRAKVLKDDVREHLERGLDDGDFRYRMGAADALAVLADDKGVGALGRRKGLETDQRVLRSIREAMRALANTGGAAAKIDRLEGDIEGLKARLGALSDRLDKMDADGSQG